MIRSFEQLLKALARQKPMSIAVAVSQDKEVLRAVHAAKKLGIADAILIGDKEETLRAADESEISLKDFAVVNVPDKEEACFCAVEAVKKGDAVLPMKGFVDTSLILKAMLDKNRGLRGEGLLSHVGVIEISGYDRLLLLSDSAMVIAPKLSEKVKIINNSVCVANALGIADPRVAVLCAVEKPNERMPATIDALELTRMNEREEIVGCLVKGPLALDNAVSEEAARSKGIDHPVAGRADILIVPDIEAGNILIKSAEYFARAKKAGVIIGAKTPIILTSRASSDETKLYSIALGVLVADRMLL